MGTLSVAGTLRSEDPVRVQHAALAYITARPDLSAATRRRLRCELSVFTRFCGPEMAVHALKRRHIEAYLASRLVAPATLRVMLSTLRGFGEWLEDSRLVKRDPTGGIRAPKVPRALPRELKHDQIGQLLLAVSDARGRLAVSLMAMEGLRIGEVVTRQIGDVDFADRSLFVKGKGGHERWLPVTPDTWAALHDYLGEYPATSGPLIRSYVHPHRPISCGQLAKLMAGWMRDAGLKQFSRDGRSAHALRHTFAGGLLDVGADIRDVQEALGHASLSATYVYLRRRRANGALREAMSRRSLHGAEGGREPQPVPAEVIPAPTGREERAPYAGAQSTSVPSWSAT